MKEWNWKIAGQAGEGVMAVSKMVAKLAKRHGLSAFNYLEYPSLIKGGHQTGQVSFAKQPIYSQRRHLDLLITFGKAAFKEHQQELTKDSVVVYNQNAGELTPEELLGFTGKVVSLPLNEFSRATTKSKLATNMVAFGVTTAAFGFDQQAGLQLVAEEFADKGEAIITMDQAAFQLGYDEFLKVEKPLANFTVSQQDDQVLLTGNEAIGLGALASGIQYYSAYPMTPASALLHFLAAQQKKYPLIVKHVEDEISAINQALGASFAGVRAMTGSSGGGFALMVEGLSLAGVMELPLVILYGQRPGPATGLPTWTSQADLQFVLRAGHGEFQRVVLTPGTAADHYQATRLAFDLAEKYHIPVFILSDKYILESHQTMVAPPVETKVERLGLATAEELPADDSFRRYAMSDSGVSPRSIPGQQHGFYVSNSYEHDHFGFATEESQMTIDQTKKRAKKYDGLVKELPQPVLIGKQKAATTFVCWGSTVNVLQDVVAKTDQANVIYLPAVWPFPREGFEALAKQAKRLVMVEGNSTGQAEQLIRQETGIEMAAYLRRYDGRPFYVEDILAWLEQ